MIKKLKIVDGWQHPNGMGLIFCKEGPYASITTAFKVKGLNCLDKTVEEKEQMYSVVHRFLSSLPASHKKRKFYYQHYGCPDFDFSETCRQMDDLLFVDEDNPDREVYERLNQEKKAQIYRFAENKEVFHYGNYFIVRCYPGPNFVKNFRDLLIKGEDRIFADEMETLEDVVEEFERIESLFKRFSPERLSLLFLANLIRGHYGLSPITAIHPKRSIAAQIFTKKMEFNPDHTRVIIDGEENDIYLRTYTVSSLSYFKDIIGIDMFNFPGDFRLTVSFYIPETRFMVFLLNLRLKVREFIDTIGMERFKDKIKQNKFTGYLMEAIDRLHEGEKDVKMAFHLTLIGNRKKDKRMKTAVNTYFTNLGMESILENSRNDAITLVSAQPGAISQRAENTLERWMTVPIEQLSYMALLFGESDEGADLPVEIDYTQNGIFKSNPIDKVVAARNVICIGGTGTGKTVRTNRKIVKLRGMDMTVVVISSKEKDYQRPTDILGGAVARLSLDGSVKLPPFSIPEWVRGDHKQLEATNTNMLYFLQRMTGNKKESIAYKMQLTLQDIFKTRDNASVSRVAEELRKRKLQNEYEALMRFSIKTPWGQLFDDVDEKGYHFDPYKYGLIFISTEDIVNIPDVFDLANLITMKSTVEMAIQKKGKTEIIADEVKDYLKDEERAMQMAILYSRIRTYGQIQINNQDTAFMNNSDIADMMLANTQRIVITGIGDMDPKSLEVLKLNEKEKEICNSLNMEMGVYAESFLITKGSRMKVTNYITPTENAISTTDDDDCDIYDYIFEQHYNESGKNSRYAHKQAIEEFTEFYPYGVLKHPAWKKLYLKHRGDKINVHREITSYANPKAA